MNYTEFKHEDGDVVYCDPPYANTHQDCYDVNGFDTESFWEWARTRDYTVYVSEYVAPDDFTCIWEKNRIGIQSYFYKNRISKPLEKVFLHNSKLNSERI